MRLHTVKGLCRRTVFQSTHPTRGCDCKDCVKPLKCECISIHAPHKGVRPGYGMTIEKDIKISIHAPHKGVRLCRTKKLDKWFYFNPRTPQGGATVVQWRFLYFPTISIHAPHKGVRQCIDIESFNFHNFNPRTPQGGATSVSRFSRISAISFQSTHPTRGCDSILRTSVTDSVISIHAPHKGVRLLHSVQGQPGEQISIHAPHKGVRQPIEWFRQAVEYFNPRTPQGGATIHSATSLARNNISIHAPHKGVRPFLVMPHTTEYSISIHAPHKGVRLHGSRQQL